MGLDVAYTKISGMSAPGGVLPAGNVAFPAGTNPQPGLPASRTRCCSASACIATSIRDRLIVDL